MNDEHDPVTPAELTKRLIDTSPQARLTIGRLADEAHISAFHLIREFRRKFFVTPHQYLIRRRIDRARRLLADTDMSVTDICFDVGFESLGSFSDLFRRAVGWPPTIYRARCLERRRQPRKFIPSCFWVMHHLGQAEPAPVGEAPRSGKSPQVLDSTRPAEPAREN